MYTSYGTEKAVGNAVRKSGVPREEIFITTKLWNNKHHPDDVAPALQGSLDNLGTDYVDMFLIHWPVAWKRGDDLFPKENGKLVQENIDIVDVCSHSLTYEFKGADTNADVQSNGTAPENRQGEGNRRLELQLD
jgi:diketogulonate reductase-like aldo/keto reductase